eukprot:TRINITY_DN227_c0_g1_i1.p1 TRINITY_DN227_c0_g1~~TRINITY_DN227_c0_g1_i1.p1  ORF type:complete len:308 (+),score=168.74 TRINITY_DN227_c0_g1_i1:58-981(+)
MATQAAQSLRFDNQVVVITGAGGGLGRAYALEFAKRGAKIVVNDLGSSMHGQGADKTHAEKVVDEIKALGAQAVADCHSVEEGEKIVETAIKTFGRIDILINNAGILRDVSFLKMKDEDWDKIYKVHMYGVYKTTKAAWNYMREQQFGRIIMTSSAAGLYGNFGQTNYSSMKIAQYGFALALAKEGQSKNILVNTIAPLAGSRMTATVMPAELVEALKPEYVAPLVCYLCHEATNVTGNVFEVGAGWVSRVRWQRTKGSFFALNGPQKISVESVRDKWSEINDFTDANYPTSASDSQESVMANLSKL